MTAQIRVWQSRGHVAFPGLFACIVVAMAARFLSDHYSAPVMLFALLLGIAFHFLFQETACANGIGMASTSILRIGVALLGIRISASDIVALGAMPLAIVVAASSLTIVFGIIVARALNVKRLGILTGGAVAICGASAALAISAVLPKHAGSERDTIFTVISVTTLSTIAMVLYPILVVALHLSEQQAGLFLGATIHDVAQVVGAGYSVSEHSGDIATYTKLLRVALLLPLVFTLSMLLRTQTGGASKRPPVLPAFLVAFLVLVVLNSMGLFSEQIISMVGKISSWCLVIAIAALGMKTSFKALAEIGWRAVALVVAQTVFIAVTGLLMIWWAGDL